MSAIVEPRARVMLTIAALALALATIAGAYGSHGLALSPTARSAYETAVAYQFYHALGLGGVALWQDRHPALRGLWLTAALLVLGMLCFCGGIYAISLGAPRALGIVVPIGGIAFIAAWFTLAATALLAPRAER